MKTTYVVQPYHVGSKRAKSIGLVIPHDIVQGYNINTSTVLLLRIDNQKKEIMLQPLKESNQKQENMRPADESFEASTQQASLKVQ